MIELSAMADVILEIVRDQNGTPDQGDTA